MSERMITMDFTDRWIRLVQQAESPQALEWVVRNAERKGYLTPALQVLIDHQWRKINGDSRVP